MSAVARKEIPRNWEKVKLGDIVNIVYGKNLRKKDLKEEGYSVYGANGIIGKYERYLYEGEQVLISCRGAYSGKANMSPPFVYITNNSLVLETPVESGLDKKYLYYWLSIADKRSLVTGSAQPQVTINNAVELIVPLAPPEQQKRIVAKIEELFSHIDAGIEALKKAKQLLKQYRQSVLKAAVTGELTKEWREQNNISQVSWQESTIGEIAKVQTGKTPKRSTGEFWKSGTIPWLTSSATNELFTHQADQFVTQIAVDSGLKLFERGTLLLAMYGEGKTRGQVTEITFQATCNQACAAIIVDEDKASRAFVRLRLNENYEQTRKAASGGNQPNLNLSKVREISLPLPTLAEQAEIVSQVEQKFEAIGRLENDLESQLLKANKNKQSILASAFLGELESC